MISDKIITKTINKKTSEVKKKNIQKRPKVGIIILNWNNYSASKRCIISLKKINYPCYNIYLIDNNSQDNSAKKLYIQFRDLGISFIFNKKNLGFAAGCNKGISKAINEGCNYVLLLNNDCIVYDKNFLKNGVTLAEKDANCGIVGGKILFWPNKKVIWSTGGYITFWSGEKHIGYKEIDNGQYNQVAERRFISGSLMLIKKEVFKKVGLLPDVYFFGKEEWEFSNRAFLSGYHLLYCPTFSVYHEASNSHEWTDPTYVYNGTLSKILYKRRNLSHKKFWIWFLTYKIYLKYLFKLKYYSQQNKYLQGIAPNVIQYAMLEALRDAPNMEKITEETLSSFRYRNNFDKNSEQTVFKGEYHTRE